MLRSQAKHLTGRRTTVTKTRLQQKVQEMRCANRALEQDLNALETRLRTVGDDAQLANIDLQNVLQKQQQTLITLSNVSKMLHDVAMSIFRKIG